MNSIVIKAVGLKVSIFILVFSVVRHLVVVSSDMWLSKWTNDNTTSINGTVHNDLTHMRLGVYALHCVLQGIS
jgi:hypothetical protein